MKHVLGFLGLLAALIALPAWAAPRPVVLELFTSNSCSSCPPAYDLLDRITQSAPDDVQLIRLDEHVDYWNQLDWVDQYSDHDFTERQRAYARDVFGANRVYTPQLVADGQREMVGSNAQRVKAAIQQSGAAPLRALTLKAVRDGASIEATVQTSAQDTQTPGRLWLALTEDHVVSHVGRGENAGRTLTEDGVVRYLAPLAMLGPDHNTSARYHHRISVPDNAQGHPLHIVVFVQQRSNHHITAAASQSVAAAN